MTKEQKNIILIISAIFVIALVFTIYCITNKDVSQINKKTDATKFKEEYEKNNGLVYEGTEIKYTNVKLDDNNVFVYKTEDEIVDILENGTGIIYFGFPMCPWCRALVPIIDEVAKEYSIDEVNYLNIMDIRDTYEVNDKKAVLKTSGSKAYYKIVNILDDYLTKYYITDEAGKEYNTKVKRLYAPTVVVVKNGEVVSFHEGTIKGHEKFTDLTNEQAKALKEELGDKFIKMIDTVCTNKGC